MIVRDQTEGLIGNVVDGVKVILSGPLRVMISFEAFRSKILFLLWMVEYDKSFDN